jgi:hypothetical protein
MQKNKSFLVLAMAIGCALSLASCTPKSNNTPAEKPQGVLSDAQKKAMEDAKKTEEVLKEANEKRMKDAE